ncbi:IS1595 family transposase [Hyphomicrobium sp.]|uniref:IS1595 family transposase n=1 Tax=Hyphomicrobium sp. TaxID=82 RepID=UPI003F7070A0
MSDVLSHKRFHDEEAAYKWVEAHLWPHGPECPRCGGTERNTKLQGKSTRIGTYKCKDCRKPFTVKVGTIFEDSHIPMRMWLQAIALMCASKKGISANQLHRMTGLTLKSAWFMSHRIREAMRVGGLKPPMSGDGGVVEVDETIYGRTSTHPKGRAQGRGFYNAIHKNVVLSLVERNGEVRSFHVVGSTISQVIPLVNENIAKEAIVMTDGAPIYANRLGKFASHDRVDHSAKEYVRYEEGRPAVHTNTVEGYFSLFKRGMRGIYQHCSEKHLHRYLAEFDFRYNARVALGVDDNQRAAKALVGAKGKRLTYKAADRP